MRLIQIRDCDDNEVIGHVMVEEGVSVEKVEKEHRKRFPGSELDFVDLGTANHCVCRGTVKESLAGALGFIGAVEREARVKCACCVFMCLPSSERHRHENAPCPVHPDAPLVREATPVKMPPGFRTGHSGDLACPHRDVSCCGTCAKAYPEIVEVCGQHFWVTDPAERTALIAEITAAKGS